MSVVIVSGAARGLGAATAARLHADGWTVVAADLDEDGARQQADRLGERAHAVRLDVREQASWARCHEHAVGLGPLEALVNNAARTAAGSLVALEPSEWDDVLAVNLRGAFLGLQAVVGGMRERGRGRVVNIASDAAFTGPGVTGAHYAASKAGLLALTRRAAVELAPSGITVNAVAPGALDGETVRSLAPDLDVVAASIPVGRLGRAEEVASLVAWLLSEDAGYVTGATFRIDGGATL